MDDGTALLAAILASPAEDTPRLVYADYLDELPSVAVHCPTCFRSELYWNSPCPTCNGTGTVFDTSNADRAALIRTQYEIRCKPYLAGVCPHCGCNDGYNHNTGCLYSREYELLAAHPEWLRCPCPRCGGKGNNDLLASDGELRATLICTTCGGDGNLLHCVKVINHGTEMHQRPVRWARGFIDSIECTRMDVIEELTVPSSPTLWALAVVRALPVTRFAITDAPISTREYGGGDERWALFRDHVPPGVWDILCPGSHSDERFVERRDRAELADALAVALASWVRGHSC